ncbi:MAG TPA: hypothetical protein PKY82_28680, partial [Pyrinomonadaceae bacterium]|nr:hypothetical protein [Pyrinomonadaceae bacterium]
GLRSEMQIEISAAAPDKPTAKKNKENPPKSNFSRHSILNLMDDTTAAPVTSKQKNKVETTGVMAALSARVAASNDFDQEIPKAPAILQKLSNEDQPKIESVEINPEAPRYIHPKKENIKPVRIQTHLLAENTIENEPIQNTSNRDYELLRAEMRELKFTFNTYAHRQNLQSWQNGVDLDLFGEVFETPFYEVYMELTGSGISPELARNFVAKIIPHYKNNLLAEMSLTQTTLVRALSSMIRFEPDALKMEQSSVIAVIGATGVGKTTTVAKIAARAALQERRRVELVTLDTYRIAAVEQLKTYAEIIGAGCHVVRSILELDVVLRRLPADALVLIDTTGKSPHDLADQYELSEYLRQNNEIRKYLAIQATTHPLDTIASIKKFKMYGADSLILTKFDETIRPGATLEVLTESDLSLAYLCMGQRVPEDMQVATPETLARTIIGK